MIILSIKDVHLLILIFFFGLFRQTDAGPIDPNKTTDTLALEESIVGVYLNRGKIELVSEILRENQF